VADGLALRIEHGRLHGHINTRVHQHSL
jgi:hypothetical protein